MSIKKNIRRGAIALVLVVALDMIAGKSFYHPLVHLYRLASWELCQSASNNCNYQELSSSKTGQAAVSTSHHEATPGRNRCAGRRGVMLSMQPLLSAMPWQSSILAVETWAGGGFMTHSASRWHRNVHSTSEKPAPLAATPTLYQDESGKVIENLSTEGYLGRRCARNGSRARICT